MTKNVRRLLTHIGNTDEQCVTLQASNAKAADELVKLGLAIFIPISTGGSQVALTAGGITEYEAIVQ